MASLPSMIEAEVETELMPLPYLIAHQNLANPKDHDLGDIMASIVRHGFVGYVTYDPEAEMMVAGHGRLKALQAMMLDGYDPPARIVLGEGGSWLVPTYTRVFTSDHERNAYTVADNRTVEKGGWLSDALVEMLEDLAKTDPTHGLDGTGYDTSDLDALLAERSYMPPAPVVKIVESQYGISVQVATKIEEDDLVALLVRHGHVAHKRFSDRG